MEVEYRMKKFLLLIVFIVISLPCFSEEIANPSIANTGFDIILDVVKIFGEDYVNIIKKAKEETVPTTDRSQSLPHAS